MVTYNGTTLTKGTDYTVDNVNQTYVGTNVQLESPVYYKTKDTVFHSGTMYYTKDEQTGQYTLYSGYIIGDPIPDSLILYVKGTWDYQKKYNIKLVVSDLIETKEFTQLVSIGQDYFEWWRDGDTNYFNVNGEYLQYGEPFSGGGGSGGGVPIGTIVEWTTDTIPSGYLLCDGSAISRTGYKDLFNKIGTTYGSGDGLTTFNLPNLKGRVPVGKDSTQTEFNNLGKTGGEKAHKLQINEMPEHNHTTKSRIISWDAGFSNHFSYSGLNWSGNDLNFEPVGDTKSLNDTGGDQPHNNLQPYITINFIIKAISETVSETVVDSLPIGSILDYDGDTVPEGYAAIANPDYSTNETKTGEFWIDGKPIYRKVILLPNTLLVQLDTWTDICDLSGLNLQTFVDLRIFFDNCAWQGFLSRIQNNKLQFYGTGRNNSAWYLNRLIMEYTKTTD